MFSNSLKPNRFVAFAGLLTSFILSQATAIAQDSARSGLKDFLTKDVIGIAYIDIANMDLNASMELMGDLGFDGTLNFQRMKEQLPEIEKDIAALKDAGFAQGYALLRTSDFQARGTSFVFPLKENADAANANKVLVRILEKYRGGQPQNFQTGSRDGAIFAAATSQFERLKNGKDESSDKDLSDMWQAVGNGSAGLFVFGDEDSRRVVGELMPPLPEPFAKLNSELIAEQTKWIGISAKLDQKPTLNIEIEANNDEAATAWQELIENGLKIAKFAPQVRDVIPKSEIKFVFNAIAPKRNGSRVSMSASKLTEDLDRLAKILAPQVKAVRKSAVRVQKMNSVRQHILAMLNYEEANRHFPTQYSVDDDGKPLLSWRVHVLPFLDQKELYDQFKLEEPWDSEHNVKLVKKMPQIFWDMRGEALESNRKGLTIFQVPAGEGLVFDAANKTGFGDLTDGSSNTISIVAMPEEKAVLWTKPVDWQLDREEPWKGLKVDGIESVVVSLCDGSIHNLPLSMKAEELMKFIDPKDGNVVDHQLMER
jgi:hypothetical protein